METLQFTDDTHTVILEVGAIDEDSCLTVKIFTVKGIDKDKHVATAKVELGGSMRYDYTITYTDKTLTNAQIEQNIDRFMAIQ